MKKYLFLLFVFVLASAGTVFSQTSFTDDFNAGTIGTGWVGSGNYVLTQSGGFLTIKVNKGNPSQIFTLNLGSSIDATAKPYLNLKLRGDRTFTLKATVYAAGGSSASKEVRVPVVSPQFQNYCFDFSAFTGKNDINKIEFAVNPNANSFGGQIYFEDLQLGTTASLLANLIPVDDIVVYKNTAGQKILVTDILNADTLTLSASALMTGVSATKISGGVSTISFNAVAPGTGVITLTAEGTGTYGDNTTQFNLTVEDNNLPTIDKPADAKVKSGVATLLKLSGISDGNISIEQPLTITAASSNAAAIPNPVITYVQGSPYATLSVNPVSAGTATITVTVKDTGTVNHTTTTTFDITSYAGFNNAPTIIEPSSQSIYNKAPFKIKVLLSGLSDGDAGTQTLTITAVGKTGKVTPTSPVTHVLGKDTATLVLTAAGLGKDTITVTVTDDGGNGSNNGNQSTSITIPVEVLAPAPTGYKVVMNDFTADTTAQLWKIESQGVTQFASYVDTLGKRCLRLILKQKMDWTGVWYNLNNLPLELDVTNAPYMSYEIFAKGIDPLATHAYFWDAAGTRNSNGATLERDTIVGISAFTKVFLDFRKPGYLDNETGAPMNTSRIIQLLFNYHKGTMKWPNTFIDGTIYITDIRIGDSCKGIPAITPVCTVNPMPTQVIWSGSSTQNLTLTGISNGAGTTTGVTVTLLSSKATLLPNPTQGTLGADGKLAISYTPAATLDSSQIVVRVNCAGSIQKEIRFWVKAVSDVATGAVSVFVDASTKGQKIAGFGGFEPPEVLLDQYSKDQGCTMMRMEFSEDVESANDNNDYTVLNRSGFDKGSLKLDYIRKAAAAGVSDIFVTLWSPPSWMKLNCSFVGGTDVGTWALTKNKVDPIMYDEYVEYMVSIVRMVKEETGLEIAGFCPQNEPAFIEPYGSAILDPVHMATVCGMLGKRLSDEGFSTKVINSEQVFTQGANSVIEYATNVRNNAQANQYTKVIAMHYPNTDAAAWAAQYAAAKAGTYPKEYWATECTTEGNNYSAVLFQCNSMITGLNNGCGAWVVWGYNGGSSGDELTAANKSGMTYMLGKSIHYHAFKNFAKFIRKDAVQLKATSGNTNIKVAAVKHDGDTTMTVVLLNIDSKTPYAVKLTGSAPSTGWDAYRTSFYERCEKVDPFKGNLLYLPPQSITTLIMKTNVNHAPTIDQVIDKFMPKNGTSTVNLTGITCGDPADQSLTVTAVSSDPAVLPNPVVTYTSPGTTGSLALAPLTDKHGAITITVTVRDNGGTAKGGVDSTKMTFLVTIPSSLNDVSEQVSLYPNPADEKVFVTIPAELDHSKLIVTNMAGMIVSEQKITSADQMELNVSQLPAGSYMVTIENDKSVAKLRFAKK